MWRYAERLPVDDTASIVTLGEGQTPLLDVTEQLADELGVERVLLKAEDRNPTGSFKARIASVALSLVRERGLRGVVGTSSGNGGAAAAAYAASSRSQAILFTLSDTVDVKMNEILAVDGTAIRVRGVGHDAASTLRVAHALADLSEAHRFYPMLTAFAFAPEAMQGVQTIAWEIMDEAPDVTVVYTPVGGGGLLTGLSKGFGSGPGSPRLVGVHPSGASALKHALRGDFGGVDGLVQTSISGLQMAALYDAAGASQAILRSAGHARSVSDAEVLDAQRMLAKRCGVVVEPAGAAAVAGIIADFRDGAIARTDHVVAVLTGAGYKDAAALEALSDVAAPNSIDESQVETVFEQLVGDDR